MKIKKSILSILILAFVIFTFVSCGKTEAVDTSSNVAVNSSSGTFEGDTTEKPENTPNTQHEEKWEIMSQTVWDDSDVDRISAHRHPNMYKDVADNSEAAYYICVFSDRGLYKEVGEVDLSEMKFFPDGELTLEVALAALHRIEMGADNADNDKIAMSEISCFSDVDTKAWYACHVAWAYENGIVDASGDTFGIGRAVTYEELATVIGNYAEKFEKKLKKSSSPAEVFADTDRISDDSKEHVEYLRLAGIVRGDERRMFNPSVAVTRADAARIFVKLDEALDYTAEELFGSDEIGYIELVIQHDGGQSPTEIEIRDEVEVTKIEKLLREAKVIYTHSESAFSGVGTYVNIVGKDNYLLCTYLIGSNGVAEYGVRYYELGEDYLKYITDKLIETNS